MEKRGIKKSYGRETAFEVVEGGIKMRNYIAYGSNMDERQMQFRCPDAKLIGKGKIKNWRLMFKGSQSGNYATIEPEKNFEVPILLWKISAEDEKNLDRYEGCPSFYYKKEIEVEMENGESTTGMVYIMHEERKLGLPTAYYYEVLLTAYLKFGFDEKILEDAIEYSDKKA